MPDDKKIEEIRISPKRILERIDRRKKAKKRVYVPKTKDKDKKHPTTQNGIRSTKIDPVGSTDSKNQIEPIEKPTSEVTEPENNAGIAKTIPPMETQKSEALNGITETDHLTQSSSLDKGEKRLGTDYPSTIRAIETTDYNHIDSEMLSRLVRLVYALALKKNEVISLKIRDVVDKEGRVVDRIRVGNDKIPVPGYVKDLIQKQIDHLRSVGGYKTQADSPLFQMKNGSKYTEVARHLKEYTDPKSKFTLNKIQQAGIECYFWEPKKIGIEERYRRTVEFARLTKREVKGIIKKQIPPAGRKKQAFERDSYMNEVIGRLQKVDEVDVVELMVIPEKLSEFDIYNFSKVAELKEAFFEAVDKNRELNKDDEGVTEEVKERSKAILKNWLIEGFKERGITFDPSTGRPRMEGEPEEENGDYRNPVPNSSTLSDIIKHYSNDESGS